VPGAPQPSIDGTNALEPIASTSRSYGSASPPPSMTSRRARSIPSARVFSHVVMLRSSYQESAFR
jgi:hypothetical protein